jgi:hypothetical protein
MLIKLKKEIFLSFIITFLGLATVIAQETAFGNLALDDFLRKRSLSVGNNGNLGWMLRKVSNSPEALFYQIDSVHQKNKLFEYKALPLFLTTSLDGKRPYVGGEYGMIPSRGAQGFLSMGVYARFSILHIQLQPEIVTAQNLSFSGFPESFSSSTIASRFFYWNVGDNPERFGNSTYTKFFWGQSSISLRAGAFELGAGTRNFWWGPGQWNSLIFSNNASGFPHISFNTNKPAKTFLGYFEGQLIIGRLESSDRAPTQIDELNKDYFITLNPDWRYLNGIMLSYSPKWIPSLTFGYSRTYQYYNESRPNDLKGWLPILEPMAKEKLFTGGNSVIYDGRGQSQQISVFGRYKIEKAKAEVYFQFGRRDHALNWREFFLNPEHARAYQVGFMKLAGLPSTDKLLQIRGELTHQQESVNRYLRYDLNGGLSWHTHGQVRGFTNFGQPMGVGIGTGSNVQTLEISLVENWNKLGILFERLENNQDFYYRAFGQQGERKPWIDWSTALLWNTSYKDLFFSARLQGTYARNYQWGLSEASTPEFPVSNNLFSVHSQVNLIYFWNRSFKKKIVEGK